MKKRRGPALSEAEGEAREITMINITISTAVLRRARTLMAHRGFFNRSEFFSTLVREEYERRGTPTLLPLD